MTFLRQAFLIALMIPYVLAAHVWGDETNGHQLIEAARSGDLALVKQLVADGVDVNAVTNFRITPLWQACSKGHRDIVEFLLEAGANPNIRDKVWKGTPLGLTNNADIVSLLVKHDAKGIEAKLRAAAFNGSMPLVTAIVSAKPLDDQVLASAKAQAQLRSHIKIAELFDEVAAGELPAPSKIREETLKSYVGKYSSERLEVVEVKIRDNQLLFNDLPLSPIDKHTFAMAQFTFTFATDQGKVVSLSRSTASSKRGYTRSFSQPDVAVNVDTRHNWTRDNGIAAKDAWPSFRGRGARGIAVDQNLPDQWDVPNGQNVRWKTPIEGLANSCPIVWKDKIFVTTAVSSEGNTKLRIGLYGEGDAAGDKSEHSWRLCCVDRQSGKILWQREADKGVPPVKRHLKSSQANSTPATDGKHVVALFNSGGLHCYDVDGKPLWKRELGVLDSGAFNDKDYQWGFASSPIIFQDTVIVQCDIQQDSFLASFEIASGEEVWRVPRDEIPSWGTPTVYETPQCPLLITNATNYVRGYDARSGVERWRLTRNAAITVPTPFVAHDLIFVTSGYRPIQPIYAIKLDATGDISLGDDEESNEHIAWSNDRGGPYLPTPIVYGDYLYTCANNGIVGCHEAKTGKRIYRARCGEGAATSFTGSLVAADGKIFVTAEAGVTFVIKSGPKFEVLGTNKLGEYCLSTPAIAGGVMVFRTQQHLVAIGLTQTPQE